MKSTIIALLLLTATAGRGQTTQTTSFPLTGSIRIGERQSGTDTINVLFLVSDTSRIYSVHTWFKMDEKQDSGVFYLLGHQIKDTTCCAPNDRVFYVSGYVVRIKHSTWAGDYKEPIADLGMDKKPLSRNFIIWQTLPRK